MVPPPPERAGPPGSGTGTGADEPPLHPNLPRRGPVLGALVAVVLAGVVGAAIGWGIVDAGTSQDAPLGRVLGAVVGAGVAAAGAAVVAVLMLRAMAEWDAHRPPARSDGDGPSRRVAPSVVVVGSVLAAVVVALVVGAVLTVRDVQRAAACDLQAIGPADEVRDRLATTGPLFLHGGGDCGYWAALEDGEIVAYDARAIDPSDPAGGECIVQHDRTDGFTCGGRPIATDALARLPVDVVPEREDGSGNDVARVDLRPADPSP